MKKNINFSIAVLSLFIVFCAGAAFGQNQQWLSIGGNAAEPILDSLLLQHSLYGDAGISSDYNSTMPTQGVIGTAGAFDANSRGSAIAGNLSAGQFQEVRFQSVSPGCVTNWDGSQSCLNVPVGKKSNAYYGTGTITNATLKNPVYDTKPKFPNVNDNAFWTTVGSATGASRGSIGPGTNYQPGQYSSISLASGQSATLKAGVYYISGNVQLINSASVTIVPDDNGSYKTIIYVKGSFTLNDNAKFVPNNPAGRGQILIIVGYSGNVTMVSESAITGTFIAPNMNISLNNNFKFSGQIMANKIGFIGMKAGQGGTFEFVPREVISDPVSITPNDQTYYKNQCGSSQSEALRIDLPQKLYDRADSVILSYTVSTVTTNGDTISAGVGVNGADAIVSPMSGSLIFPAGTNSASINLIIVNNGLWDSNAAGNKFKAFKVNIHTVRFAGQADDNRFVMPPPGEFLMKIKMAGTEQTKPSKPGWNLSTNYSFDNKYGIIENPSTTGGSGANIPSPQTVGTLSSTTNTGNSVTYEIISVVSPSGVNANWFNIQGANIITTSSYAADYENSAHRTITLAVRANAAANLDCVRQSDTSRITINVLPWNDNKFKAKDVTKTINELGSATVSVSDWLVSNSNIDAPDNLNVNRVFRISSTKNGTASQTAFNGGSVSLSNNGDVLYSQAGITNKFSFAADTFWLNVRDEASYGYETAYFDTTIMVEIRINHTNRFPPHVNNIPTVTLPEDSVYRLKISDFNITDPDRVVGAGGLVIVNTNHYEARFAGTPVSLLKAGENTIKVGIINGELVYDLRDDVPASYEFGALFKDTITVYIENTDGDRQVTVKIPVVIKPVNDISPVVNDFEADVIAGLSMLVEIPSGRVVDGDFSSGNQTVFIQRDGFEIIDIKDISSPLVNVSIEGGGFRVEVSNAWNPTIHGNTATFKYKVKDICDYDARRNESVSYATVTLNIVVNTYDFIMPERDTIIVLQNNETSLLHNGKNSVVWNDYAVLEGSLSLPDSVKVTKAPVGYDRFKFLNASLGTFLYENVYDPDGENALSNELSYAVRASASEIWSNDVPGGLNVSGVITVLVNQLNMRDPELTAKEGVLRAKQKKTFKLIDNSDIDLDPNTFLGLNMLEGSYGDGGWDLDDSNIKDVDDMEIELSPKDGSISFKYTKEVKNPYTITIYFWVTDTLRTEHWEYDNGIKRVNYIDKSGSHKNKITFTVMPNPQAVDFDMFVKEGEETDLLYKHPYNSESVSYRSLGGDIDADLIDGFTRKDNVKNGVLSFNRNSGRVIYFHDKESGALTDTFTYWLIYTFDDGSTDSLQGSVFITVNPREPYALKDGSFYKDTDGDGIIDSVYVPFDRNVDVLNTSFEVSFAGKIWRESDIEYNSGGYPKEIDGKWFVAFKLEDGPVDVTDGFMTVNIIHEKYDGIRQTVNPVDSAAPVIKGISARYIKSLIPDGNDTLILEMSEFSEIPLGGGNLPFRFAATKDGAAENDYFVSFDEKRSSDNKSYTFVIGRKDSGVNAKISEGDWVYVNFAAAGKITDLEENPQDIEKNKRVEITMETVTQIISAVYFDTNSVKDGYIDLIKIGLGVDSLKEDVARDFALNWLSLSPSRNFIIDDVKVVDGIIELYVEEANARNVKASPKDKLKYPAQTSILEDDYILLNSDFAHGLLTIKSSGVMVKDSVAPVIFYANYILPNGNNRDTTLEIVFSENVYLTLGNPYLFWDTDPGKQYHMDLSFVSANGSVGKYKVLSVEIPYPVGGDSIKVISGNSVFDGDDRNGNEQTETVYAPLLPIKYPPEFDLFVVPNPLFMLKVGDKGYEPNEFADNFMNYYSIPRDKNKGVAIILEAKGPVLKDECKGSVKIIDQTGNVVNDGISMTFDDTERGVAGVAVWNGKNRAGRTVGAATYLAIVEIEAAFEGQAKEARVYRKAIIVTTSGKQK